MTGSALTPRGLPGHLPGESPTDIRALTRIDAAGVIQTTRQTQFTATGTAPLSGVTGASSMNQTVSTSTTMDGMVAVTQQNVSVTTTGTGTITTGTVAVGTPNGGTINLTTGLTTTVTLSTTNIMSTPSRAPVVSVTLSGVNGTMSHSANVQTWDLQIQDLWRRA